MSLLTSIKKFFTTKVFDPLENIDLNNVVGWKSIGGSSTYGWYQDNQYENGYSSIRVLAESFAALEQYTIDKTGKSVASNVLDRLYTPNTDMSAYDFREALMVTTLVHDKVRLKVHHKGVHINADSLLGFTFMEGYSEKIIDGKREYMMPNGENLTDAEVITLKSTNPYDINSGFSPSRAARRWTRLDDYIADYQKGFFENGAVPSGQFIITASTVGEFNEIVDTLQARHRGAGKSNNVTYTHRPTDQTGKPMNSQIEWVPFATPNKDMALKELFDNVNKKIDSVYGVPASLRAVNDANTYASIRVDETILVKYGLNPKAMKVWSKFTHELNRITGGLGVAISYDLEMPIIADEEKVKAESRQIDAATVSTLTAEGYTLESAVEYVKKGDLTVLVLGEPPEEDKPEVLSAEEAKGTPDQPIDIYSKKLKLLDIKMEILESKYNTNHDTNGRFASGGSSGGVGTDQGDDTPSQSNEYITSTYGGGGGGSYTAGELAAVKEISLGDFDKINGGLRRGDSPSSTVKNLDSAMGKTKLKENTFLYRGVGNESGQTLKVGEVYRDKGFPATSMNKTTAYPFLRDSENGYVFRISAKKGTNVVIPSLVEGAVGPVSQEAEMLLPRSSAFKIGKITPSHDDFGVPFSMVDVGLL